MAVMQEFSNVVSTLSHDLKPVSCESPQVFGLFRHQGIDGGVPSNRAGEPKESIQCDFLIRW